MSINIFLILLLMISGGIIASYVCCIVERNNFLTFNRSRCDFCKKTLTIKELFPIISYLILKGKCKHCKKNIPKKYIYFEIFLTILLPVYYSFSIQVNLLTKSIELISIVLLTYLFYLDWEKMLIDMRVILLLFILVLLKYLISNIPIIEIVFHYSLAMLLGFAFLFLISYLYNKVKNIEGMGSGDPYLAGVLGFIYGIDIILPIIIFGSVLGIIYHFCNMGIKEFNLKKKIPFGSFLILSAITVNLFDILFLSNFTFIF